MDLLQTCKSFSIEKLKRCFVVVVEKDKKSWCCAVLLWFNVIFFPDLTDEMVLRFHLFYGHCSTHSNLGYAICMHTTTTTTWTMAWFSGRFSGRFLSNRSTLKHKNDLLKTGKKVVKFDCWMIFNINIFSHNSSTFRAEHSSVRANWVDKNWPLNQAMTWTINRTKDKAKKHYNKYSKKVPSA